MELEVRAEVDVLVVGGGLAGLYAALTAQRFGARTALVSKGPIGRSGGSAFAGTLVSWTDHRTNQMVNADADLAERKRDHIAFYHYLMDADHMIRSEDWVREQLLSELERLGLYFRRMPDGRVLHHPEKTGETWTPREGSSGRVLGDLLRRIVFDSGVEVYEECVATSLLSATGECAGATFYDIVSGGFHHIPARATILATGHANYLAKRSTATREVCGDGFSLPYRAGAELFNLEMQQWHVSDLAWPPAWQRVHVYPNPLPGTIETSRLVAGDGTVLYEQKLEPGTLPYANQHYRLYQYAAEHGQDYAQYKTGGYYSDLRHIDEGVRDEYSTLPAFLSKLGIDPRRELVENAPCFHYVRGGVFVDFLSGESTTVPRLFAVGGAAGRDGQTNCMYDGKCAAEWAIDHYSDTSPQASRQELDSESARLSSLLSASDVDAETPIRIKLAIRELMTEHMGYVKSEARMREALEAIRDLRLGRAASVRVSNPTKRYNYEMVDALDVHTMLDACELQIVASLERKESRGPFFREDYPEQDNDNWLRYIILRNSDSGASIRSEPVSMEGVAPPLNDPDPFPHRSSQEA